jgi:hypothetical protein
MKGSFLPVVAVCTSYLLSACGGSGTITRPPPNPVPPVAALSPNSSEQGGPAFTLSVVGANFISGSSVQWNGNSLPTTLVNGSLLTANIPVSAVATAGPDSVSVLNPGPGGGASNSLNVTVPCVIPPPESAAAQTRAGAQC